MYLSLEEEDCPVKLPLAFPTVGVTRLNVCIMHGVESGMPYLSVVFP